MPKSSLASGILHDRVSSRYSKGREEDSVVWHKRPRRLDYEKHFGPFTNFLFEEKWTGRSRSIMRIISRLAAAHVSLINDGSFTRHRPVTMEGKKKSSSTDGQNKADMYDLLSLCCFV
ncbi:hypothetical protein BaRGS_00029503 [Batillaria attramentaria]|uniref:Uncharacterized protein n=1 Tax=Batillaria attramentaria TaxID=370345 RepID=A0ABD0JW03_9CAEN